MSLRLRLLNRAARRIARPVLEHAGDVARARRDFERLAWLLKLPPGLLHLVDFGTPALHWISVRRRQADHVILYLQGGAYVAGSPVTHSGMVGRIACLTGLQVMEPDYRVALEHPAPAAFEDARKAHASLLVLGYPPDRILLGGDSAGGGLALALLADLCQRNQAPVDLFAFSPWTDLALTGGSIATNAGSDSLLPPGRMEEAVDMVLAGTNAGAPRVSPLYASFDTPPPVLIQVGAGEILQDYSRRMAEVLRRAGGQVTLQEWPDCLHVWQTLGSNIKCNTYGPQGIGCCDGQTIQAPLQRGTWRDFGRASAGQQPS